MKVLGPDVRVTDAALAQIVIRAAEGVDGVRVRRPRRKVAIDVDGTNARVDLSLAIAYGKVLPDVARDVQQEVAGTLERMCSLAVDTIDVSVEELDAP